MITALVDGMVQERKAVGVREGLQDLYLPLSLC